MARNGKNVVETVRELAEPAAESLGCWVWDVEFVKEGTRKILRITIDSEEGIDINVCEKMHRTMDVILDEADPIAEPYYLEISSPGIERELKTPVHIEACEGWDVEVKLYAPIDGMKAFRGVLLASDNEDAIKIKIGDTERVFEKQSVAKISTYFDFNK